MTTYVLELRSTANWQDIRYREYTTSAKKAELFKDVPRISFTDSGHGIVPHVREHSGHREPRNMLLADHVRDHITAKGREVKALSQGPDVCPSCAAGTRHWWSYCAMCGYHIASGALALSRPER
jgi:hypothetical protein